MVTPIRIGITGTHSTGKTTLARRIEMELRARGLAVARTGGLAKRAAALGLPKMTLHTAASTEWIIATGAAAVIEAELHADVVLVDRTAHDAIAYYLAALEHRNEHPDPADLDRLTALATLHARRQAVLLATVPDPDALLADRTGREPARVDLAFRESVDEQLHRFLDLHAISHVRVCRREHAEAVAYAVHAVTDGRRPA